MIETAKIRNVGVVGHGGVGKTSLVEALLFTAGAVTRLGKVDDGSTTTDFDPDKIKRKISINTAVAYCDWKGHRVTFVDTPGYGDFIADARAGLRVVEAAVVVMDAVAGVQVQTEKVWKFATEYGLLRAGIAAGKLVPVLCASASRNVGSHALLDLVVDSLPAPADRGEVAGTDLKTKQPGTRPPDPKAPVTALVFKTLSDPHIGKLSLFRVYSGTLRSDSTLLNASRGVRERMGHVSWLMGKTQKNVEALGPGEIGVAQKLKETLTGDTLTDEAQPFELPRITFPEAAISFAIQPKTRGDEDKISNALARIAEEDPTVHYHYDPETKQLLVAGVGSLHVEMVVERMKRKYNVDVNLLPPRIPYKEAVKGRAEGQGKYKKQTGGRGQYGDVWLRVEPLPRGGGFEFVDEIFGGAVPRNYIPSAEKGVRDCMKKGILAGYPIVDLRVILYDGTYHEVDSSDMAFQIAASLGLQKVFLDAHPILLEPIMNVEVTAPSEVAGDIIGDLNSRRGRIVGMEPAGETAAVRATVPMAEMLTYESSLRSMTGGRGAYSMAFSHYEEVPAFLAEKVTKEAKTEKEKAEKH